MRLVKNKVLINTLPEDSEVMYKGMVALPDSARGFSTHGVIEAVGPDVRTVIPSEWVVFNRRFAQQLPDDNRRIIIDERYLMAVLALDSEIRITAALVGAETHADITAALTAAGVVIFHTPDVFDQETIYNIVHTEATIVCHPTFNSAVVIGYALGNRLPVFMPAHIWLNIIGPVHRYANPADLVTQLTQLLRKGDK
jgi:hypothetical protein